jgi:hypothetical protein
MPYRVTILRRPDPPIPRSNTYQIFKKGSHFVNSLCMKTRFKAKSMTMRIKIQMHHAKLASQDPRLMNYTPSSRRYDNAGRRLYQAMGWTTKKERWVRLDFPFLQSARTHSGAHPASISMRNGCKAAGTLK